MTAAALQGTAVAATPDRSDIQVNMDSVLMRGGFGPNADAPDFAGYVGLTNTNRNAVTTLTVNKTGTCNATLKGVAGAVFNYDQVGPDFAAALVLSVCNGGTPDFFIRTLDSDGNLVDAPNPVSAGDKIKVTITNSATANKIKVQNLTKGYTVNANGGPITTDSIQVGNIRLTDGTNYIPMPNFKKTAIQDTKIGGVVLKNTDPTKYQMKPAGTVLVATSAIAADNMDFSLTWKAAQ
jgi:hypothetical protein